MFNRILVATDASDFSRRALITAIEIAKQFHSEIELFHVIVLPLPYLGNDFTGYYTPFKDQEIKEIGDKIMDLTLNGIDIGQVEINKKVITGHPATAVLDEIRRDIDLVVMGTRGHGPLTGAVTGSVTQRVLAGAPCPVLIVK